MSIKIWKDKSGKRIDFKEFKQRFAQGVQSVSPLAQVNSTLLFTWITLLGILCGLCLSLFYFSKFWWGAIILFAAAGNTIVSIIGLKQKQKQLKDIQKMIDRVNDGVSKEVKYAN